MRGLEKFPSKFRRVFQTVNLFLVNVFMNLIFSTHAENKNLARRNRVTDECEDMTQGPDLGSLAKSGYGNE